MKHLIYPLVFALILLSCKEKTPIKVSKVAYLDEASIELLDQELNKILDADQKIEILAEGHDWTEGPLWLETEQSLLYSDIPRNAVYAWNADTGVKEYLKPAGYVGENFQGSEPGSNGLLLSNDGALVLCQHGDRQVVKMNSPLSDPKPEFIALANNYLGKRFNSPNDAVFDKAGNLYFTDPPYGLPKGMEDPEKELDFQGVFRLDTTGAYQLISKELTRPNGIAFSPDESTLYVANSDPEKAIWMVYDLDESGKVSSENQFFDATHLVKLEKGLPDGLKVNGKGYIFATGPGGVFIFTPAGTHLGTIKTGQATSNCAFNADQSELFITADSYVLRVLLK
jgi:gluconolactonase